MPLVTMALFIQNKARTGAQSGKIQVIDKYGRTAWVTKQELDTHSIPVYSNGPADLDKDYRPAYVGEEELMKFVRTFLGIPTVTVWDNNLRKMVPNPKVKPEECECRFDNLENIFKGDFSEIQNTLGLMPNNKLQVLLGVRTDIESGRLYQAVYTKNFLSSAATNFNSLQKEINEMISNATANGRTLNTEYEVTKVHEYSVKPTVFTETTETTNDIDPFATESGLPWD